jgi:hypothetical protein
MYFSIVPYALSCLIKEPILLELRMFHVGLFSGLWPLHLGDKQQKEHV